MTTFKTKAPSNRPKLICVQRSRIKLPIRRGPKVSAAKDTATIVIENMTPATPITAVASVDSVARVVGIDCGRPTWHETGHQTGLRIDLFNHCGQTQLPQNQRRCPEPATDTHLPDDLAAKGPRTQKRYLFSARFISSLLCGTCP